MILWRWLILGSLQRLSGTPARVFRTCAAVVVENGIASRVANITGNCVGETALTSSLQAGLFPTKDQGSVVDALFPNRFFA